MAIFTSVNSLSKQYIEVKSLNDDDLKSLELFFKRGGVIKTNLISKKINVNYPDKKKIDLELKELYNELKIINEKIKTWEKVKHSSQNYKISLSVGKYKEPLYWKHLYKNLFDKDYKDGFKRAKLSIDLISDKNTKKVIKEFMDNKNYRETLIQTMETSMFYKDKEIGKQLEETAKLKSVNSTNKLEHLDKIKKNIEKLVNAYKVISRWT